MSFQIDPNYVDVAARIREFREKHPDGSLQQHNLDFREFAGNSWVIYTAAAYRSPEDAKPGIGTAWEPVPGRTTFTKDSELQNAETAAWGRAIVAALAADTNRGIASQEEVRNRRADREAGPPPLAAAKSRAWVALKALHPHDDDETRTEFTKAALEARGSSIAAADTATWNALADEWNAAKTAEAAS